MSDDELIIDPHPEDDEEDVIYDSEEYTGPGEQKVEKPSKDEFTVAKWLKKNVKTKKTKFLSHNVEYFTSNKAIDALMKSKFAEGDNALFATRELAVEFMDIMLEHKFFHRAKKVPVTLDELRGSGAGAGAKATTTNTTTEKSGASSSSTKKEEKKSDKQAKKEKDKDKDKEKEDKKDTEAEAEASAGNGVDDGNANASDKKAEKRKRKIRLDMHPEQIFVDGSEAYVWIYDPIPLHYWVIGFVLLLGAIGICLFPLWPPMLRKGVYYISLLAAGFLVFILTLTVVRLIVFTIVWAITAGKLHFWIFPNLTEDVGFFASFWPLYESNYVDDKDKNKSEKRSKSKSKKKDKDSDAEDDEAPDAVPLETAKIEEIKEHDADMELRQRNVATIAAATAPSSDSADETVDDKQDEVEAEDDSQGSEDAADGESDAKGSSRQSETDSDGSIEIISSSEVQNVN